MRTLADFFKDEPTKPTPTRRTAKWEKMETKVLHILFISKLLGNNPKMTAVERNRILNGYFPEISKDRSKHDTASYWMWRTQEAKRFNTLLEKHNLRIVAI